LGLCRSAALADKQGRTAKGAIRLGSCLWLSVKYENRHLILGGGFLWLFESPEFRQKSALIWRHKCHVSKALIKV
jgi:hypothetical protein